MAIDTKLKSQLEEMDQTYGNDMYKMLGSTLLSYTTTDSSRMYMFTSHVKQILALLNPDVPKLQTGFENSIGKYSNAFKRVDGTWEVKDVIKKFPNVEGPGIYSVVLYNKKNDLYDMFEVPVAEDLVEKFGFVYDSSRLDNIKVGDKLKDEVIYKSTSFDSQMNYRMGKNAVVYYSTSTDTIEDAVVVRKGWADSVKTVEIDSIQVSINTNEVLLNLYGDDNTYKSFPDIGESVKNARLCATRVINYDHILYDFQKKNMQDTVDTDAEYFTSKHAVIYDIDVFYNGDREFPNTLFYNQLCQYYEAGNEYAKRLYRWADEIKKSGSKYTDNVSHMRSRYMHWADPEYKWKNKDRAFANLLVEFKVKSVMGLEYGSKLAGRFGNKGVISGIVDNTNSKPSLESIVGDMLRENNFSEEDIPKFTSNITVVDDSRIPYTEDGPIDVLMNASGSIRRLNPGQLCEVEINFIGNQVRKKICACKTYEEKEELIFKFLDIINDGEASFFRKLYQSFDTEIVVDNIKVRLLAPDSRRAFIEDVEKNGFYIVRPPHKPLLYQDIIALYDAFPDIGPIPLYIDLFGIKRRRVIKNGICGEQYLIILKQNSSKNFSARSTFRVNRSNLPTKDTTKKTNRSSYARTPVKLSEIYNLMASISGRDLAEYNIFMRSSPIGSKSLDRILNATKNPLKVHKLKVKDNYTNTNADILNARLKAIGLALEFTSKDDEKHRFSPDTTTDMHFGSYCVFDRFGNYEMYEELFREFRKHMRSFTMIESYVGEKEEICWNRIFSNKELTEKYEIGDETKNLLLTATKGKSADFMKRLAEERKAINPETGKAIPKKRGRKPKKKYEDLVNEVLAANQQDAEEDAEDYERDELIEG